MRRHSSSGVQELIVVTILLAARGSLKIPTIQSQGELREALNKLGAVRSEQVGAGLAWPQRVLPGVLLRCRCCRSRSTRAVTHLELTDDPRVGRCLQWRSSGRRRIQRIATQRTRCLRTSPP